MLSFGNAQESQPGFHFFPTELGRSLEQVENLGEQGFDIFGWVFQFYENNALQLKTGLRTVGPEQVREQGSEQGSDMIMQHKVRFRSQRDNNSTTRVSPRSSSSDLIHTLL